MSSVEYLREHCERCNESGIVPCAQPSCSKVMAKPHNHVCMVCHGTGFVYRNSHDSSFSNLEDKTDRRIDALMAACRWAHNELSKRGYFCRGDCGICEALDWDAAASPEKTGGGR